MSVQHHFAKLHFARPHFARLHFARLHFASLCVALLCVALANVSAIEPLRFRTVFMDFKPTAVSDSAIADKTIDGLPPQTAYRILDPLKAPFTNLTPLNALISSGNGQMKITVKFKPPYAGPFQDDLLLVTENTVPSADTIRIRVTGSAFNPLRYEQLDFGRVIVGFERTARIFVRKPANDDATWEAVPVTKPTPPFSLTSTKPEIFRGDTAYFEFKFAPTKADEFKDTVLLVRRHASVAVDTIVVYLRGVGVSLNTRTEISFGKVITGDSVVQRKAFLKPFPHVYEVVSEPKDSPFKLIREDKGDSVIAYVQFMPEKTGLYSDKIILARRRQTGTDTPFDSINVSLVGTAVGMQEEAAQSFTRVHVGDVVRETLRVELDAEPQNVEFGYQLVAESEVPVVGRILSPVGASKQDFISIEFTCAPTVFASTQQTFKLIRTKPGRQSIDTAVIAVFTSMEARPVELSLKLETDTTKMKLGEHAMLRLVLVAHGDFDEPILVSSLKGRIKYNPTMLIVQRTSIVNRIVLQDAAYIEFNSEQGPPISISSEETVVGEIDVLAVIGDADFTNLEFSDWTIAGNGTNEKPLETSDGAVVITNPWRYSNGGVRFVNTLQGVLSLDVSPNPVVTESVIRIGNVPQGFGELTIIDAHGVVVQDLTEQVRQGTREFAISKEGGAIQLRPGSYYVRLMCRGEASNTINRVVRLFVVQ